MAIRRWTFSGEGETWTVPQNPREMSSPFPTRNVSGRSTVGGRTLLTEGSTPPANWQFGGSIRSREHYDELRRWVYEKKQRVTITDHFGRQIVCVLISFEPVPKRSVNVYWRHDYSIKAIVVSVSNPTVGNAG